jgi:hypothetical protein
MYAPAERPLMDKLESYYFGNQSGAWMHGKTVKCCMICGALVADIPVHIRFHESLPPGE